MELCSILAIFFLIGGIGIFLINKKSKEVSANKNHWKKYSVYLVLVFGQLFLIQNKGYNYFGILILLFGFYEIIKIGKSKKNIIFALLLYFFFGWFFFSFFTSETLIWQQFLFVIVISFDGYSQLFGQLFGRTKLFPKISPNKTLEGLFGGIISVIITAIILSNSLKIEIYKAIVFGFVIAILAFFGDFLASFYKRINNAKDYSQFIPSHGGFLDRFDSLIFAGFAFSFLLKIDFSNTVILIFAIYILLFLMLFLTSEIICYSLKFKVEISRKFVHFTSGIICLSFPFYIKNHWIVLALCSGFLLLLFASQKFKFLKSINDIGRKSYGSLLFPVSVYCCFLNFQYHNDEKIYFYLPILILAICDPLASLIGKKYPFLKYKNGNDYKTIMGSSVFFVASFLIAFIAFRFHEIPFLELLLKSFFISIIATLAEAFSKKGTDNLFIPLAVIALLN
ncbi:phosphatidate cytidylyltransferase [uncultured Flavobacterium sp.]|uniref:phosphatidate cytidylyltransferase n=1 Tax=uncultured Flavobacterium sp. TaxID=165435 RepID=UPI0025EC3FAC|nr:phosphatidate cytidylyltransferase [uncultured Flavobacterium sp.]